MKENDIDRILAGSFTGEKLSEEEKCLLEEWKRENECRNRFEGELHELRKLGVGLKYRENKDFVFARIERIVQKQRKEQLFIRWSSVAAGIMLLLGIMGYFIYSQEDGNEIIEIANIGPGSPKAELILPQGQVIELDSSFQEIVFAEHQSKVASVKNTLIYDAGMNVETIDFHTIRVPLGGEFNLQLSDNTRVHLNSGSSLRYPVRFAGDIREVFLTGEGFFEVTKDEERPFVVKTEEVDVRVLGTSFNVNAYPDEKVVATTLVEGKIRVGYGSKNFDLDPGMQFVYDREDKTANVRTVDMELYTSWKDGYYVFYKETLENIMERLVHWYGVEVSYQNEELRKIEFVGRLHRYERIDYLLKRMADTQNVEFVINGNVVEVKNKTD